MIPIDEPDSNGRRTSEKSLSIKIREMEIDDIPRVFHLGEQLFAPRAVPNMYRTWDPYEVTGMFNEDSEFCLVAEADDEVVGFALGTTITKSHSAWKYGYLIWLGVAPEFQRHGVADRLYHRFKDLMIKDGVRMILVDTQADNRPAVRFFEKIGFGSSEEHIYLTMNLDAERQRRKGRKNRRVSRNRKGEKEPSGMHSSRNADTPESR